jgi:hypothetical protein
MAYGSVLTDVVQSSVTGTPPQFNDGAGTQTGTLCRAWINYKGTATRSIRASFNVSSVTFNSTGDYTVNFTNALPDANFAVLVSAVATTYSNVNDANTTTSARVVITAYTLSNADSSLTSIAIFR